jgi:hypothetical protein
MGNRVITDPNPASQQTRAIIITPSGNNVLPLGTFTPNPPVTISGVTIYPNTTIFLESVTGESYPLKNNGTGAVTYNLNNYVTKRIAVQDSTSPNRGPPGFSQVPSGSNQIPEGFTTASTSTWIWVSIILAIIIIALIIYFYKKGQIPMFKPKGTTPASIASVGFQPKTY